MKKVFLSLFAALAMFFMVSCGAAEGVQDGETAAKEYAEAFQSGDPQSILNAYNSIATKYGAKYQSAGTVALAGYIGGLSTKLDETDPKINGTYFGIMLANAKIQNLDVESIQKAVDNAKEQSKDKAAFQAGVDLAASWYAAPAQEEQPAEAEGEGEGEGEEEAE